MSEHKGDHGDALTPLTEKQQRLIREAFADFWETPGKWKVDLLYWLQLNFTAIHRSAIVPPIETSSPLEVTDRVTFVENVTTLDVATYYFTVDDLSGGDARINPSAHLVGFDKTNTGTTLVATASSTIQWKSSTIVRLTEASGRVDFSVQKSGSIGVVEAVLNNSTDVFRVTDAGGTQPVKVTGNGDVTIGLRSGRTLTIEDASGNPIMVLTG